MKAKFRLIDAKLKSLTSYGSGSEDGNGSDSAKKGSKYKYESRLVLDFELVEMDSWMLSDLNSFLLSLCENKVEMSPIGKVLDVRTVFQDGKFNVKLIVQLNDNFAKNIDLEELKLDSWEIEKIEHQGDESQKDAQQEGVQQKSSEQDSKKDEDK